jgi:hypothetical protein
LIFSSNSPDIRTGQIDFQLQSIDDADERNRTIVIQFHIGANATELPKNISYTLQVPHIGLQTRYQYLEAVRDSYFDPVDYAQQQFPYQNSCFLALKLTLDNILCELLQRDSLTQFEVSTHVDGANFILSNKNLFQDRTDKIPSSGWTTSGQGAIWPGG